MRISVVFLNFSCLFLLSFTACENAENNATSFSNSAVAIGEEFIKKLYTIDNQSLLDFNNENEELALNYQDEFSTYLTEKEHENLSIKRLFLMPQELAFKHDLSISVQNIEIEQYANNKEKNSSND